MCLRNVPTWLSKCLPLALLLSAMPGPGIAAAESRPNFLFIYTDDQRWDALGAVQREMGDKARFPWLQTPHLDRLAAEGVRFRNAFVVNSLCAPSRATFLTGCYGHVNGIVNNHTDFPAANVTHASLLRAAGYVTGYIGKWHMGKQSGQRPGFDYSASFIGQGKYFYTYFGERGFTAPTTQAVRTETAKLIRYPGHAEWSEMFDLAADPQELRNLYGDPARAALRKELETEFERQAERIAFKIPDFADGQASAGPQALNAWVLEYRFDRDQGDQVIDASGQGNHGRAHGVAPAAGREGRQARRFDGRGYIDVPKSESLRPNVPGLAIEVSLKAEGPDGVVLARGGRSAGYCLYLDQGCPVLAVTASDKLTQIRGKQSLVGGWADVSARITADRRLVLTVNGKRAAEGKLPAAIDRDPNDTLQLGADLRSPVVEGRRLPGFVGLVEALRLYSGEAP